MSFRLGDTASSDLNWVVKYQIPVGGSAFLVCGRWRPTTLTAGRGLWSFGNNTTAEIASTTSELVLRTQNTTNGQWTTTGAGLAVNQWRFLAFFLSSNNTGPAAQWIVWSSGNLEDRPAKSTITQNTAPVGNFVGSNTFYAGNVGTSTTQAFQGQISAIQIYQGGHQTRGPFRLSSAAAVTAEQENYIYETFVVPAWQGNFWPQVGSSLEQAFHDWAMYVCPLDHNLRMRRFDDVVGASISGSNNGGTFSTEGPPAPIDFSRWNKSPGYLRR